jgi:hypothetical protein
MNKLAAGIAIIFVLIIAGGIYYFYFYNNPSGNVSIALTDPANVPAGTQSLNISYSGVQAHTIGSSGSSWTSLSTSGSIDLLSLYNSSIDLGSFSASNGTVIDAVRFNVTSASIEINNTIYPVILSSQQLTATVSGSNVVNGTTKILVDLSPTVMEVLSQNSTTFIMVPSMAAVIIPHDTNIIIKAGATENLNKHEYQCLFNETPKISITSASLSMDGNSTSLSITVKDNSNRSVILRQVLLFGNPSVYLPNISVQPEANLGGEISIGAAGNVSVLRGGKPQVLNSTVSNALPIISREMINIGERLALLRSITFQISPNGTLFIPFFRCTAAIVGNNHVGISPLRTVCPVNVNYSSFEEGYTLSAGQSVTLTFNGKILLGLGYFQVNVVPGKNYNIVVQGSGLTRAYTNVTAT